MINRALDVEVITDDDLKIASGGGTHLENLTDNTAGRIRRTDTKLSVLAFLGPPEFAGIS